MVENGCGRRRWADLSRVLPQSAPSLPPLARPRPSCSRNAGESRTSRSYYYFPFLVLLPGFFVDASTVRVTSTLISLPILALAFWAALLSLRAFMSIDRVGCSSLVFAKKTALQANLVIFSTPMSICRASAFQIYTRCLSVDETERLACCCARNSCHFIHMS
jgi:hypothetical protein